MQLPSALCERRCSGVGTGRGPTWLDEISFGLATRQTCDLVVMHVAHTQGQQLFSISWNVNLPKLNLDDHFIRKPRIICWLPYRRTLLFSSLTSSFFFLHSLVRASAFMIRHAQGLSWLLQRRSNKRHSRKKEGTQDGNHQGPSCSGMSYCYCNAGGS
jgi:hypothetical protein